jgi:predicted DsbA family dithiol-disulfide isomerase
MVIGPESYPTAASVLILAGLVVAALSILEPRVEAIARLCAFFGEGCRKTATFRLLRIPIAWWGALYYIGMGALFLFARPLAFWGAMTGFGIEATFLTIIVLIRALCVFCLLNSIVVTLLALFSFDIHRAWPAAATILASFAGSLYLIFRENGLSFRKPPRDLVLSEIEEEAVEGENPALGPQDAPVTVIEFSDYLCPFCRRSREMVSRIKKDYAGRIRWVYMDFPLEIHQGAKQLAQAARCARDQGKFWEFQELILASQEKPGPDRLRDFAKRLSLNPDRFSRCLESGRHIDEIDKDIKFGSEAGVHATPTFLVNGKPKVAPTYEELHEAIEEELRAHRRRD